MKKCVLMLLFFVFVGCGSEHSNGSYMEDGDRNSNPTTPTELAFIGDSITYLKMWQNEWPEKVISNYGICGATTSTILDNIDSYMPSNEFVILIGINDFFVGPSDGFLDRYKMIVDKIKFKSNNFYCGSILPVNHTIGYFLTDVDSNDLIKANIHIREICVENGGTYIDTYTSMLEDGTNELNPNYTTDGLHLNSSGYDDYVKTLKEYIK